MIEQLISRVFYARNLAHFAHWRAKGEGSAAKHKALGEFYEAIIDTIDPLVEAYQGAYEMIGAIPVPGEMQTDILKCLESDAEWIEANHDKISKGNRAVGNLIDTLTAVYLSAIYQLRYLR
jgi:DNA-binding ferritin-like protein